jgi:hypothetical protein
VISGGDIGLTGGWGHFDLGGIPGKLGVGWGAGEEATQE